MGEAKRRGTKEQRVEEAEFLIRERDAAAERAELEHNLEVARKWALLSKEEKEARLESAKEDARNYGEMVEMFGSEAGGLMANIMADAKHRGKRI